MSKTRSADGTDPRTNTSWKHAIIGVSFDNIIAIKKKRAGKEELLLTETDRELINHIKAGRPTLKEIL